GVEPARAGRGRRPAHVARPHAGARAGRDHRGRARPRGPRRPRRLRGARGRPRPAPGRARRRVRGGPVPLRAPRARDHARGVRLPRAALSPDPGVDHGPRARGGAEPRGSGRHRADRPSPARHARVRGAAGEPAPGRDGGARDRREGSPARSARGAEPGARRRRRRLRRADGGEPRQPAGRARLFLTPSMPRVCFVTCRAWPEISASDRLVADALAPRGVHVEGRAWNEPGAEFTGFDAVVLRSNWDYHLEPDAFLAWLDGIERAGVRLFNPPALVRWNVSKRYLLALAAA